MSLLVAGRHYKNIKASEKASLGENAGGEFRRNDAAFGESFLIMVQILSMYSTVQKCTQMMKKSGVGLRTGSCFPHYRFLQMIPIPNSFERQIIISKIKCKIYIYTYSTGMYAHIF